MINSEATLAAYPIRMDISIPGSGDDPQTIRQLLNQTDSFFNKRPDLLNKIIAISILDQSDDFEAGTINADGDDWEAETTQLVHSSTDAIPYSEPFVTTIGIDIEALRSSGAGAVTAVAVCYLGTKENSALDHSAVEVPA